MNMRFNKFAERLHELMDKNGVTVVNVATATDITREALSRYLDGSLSPNIENLYKISRYFCVSTDYLLGADNLNEVKYPLLLTLSELKDILDKLTPKGGNDPYVQLIMPTSNGVELLDIFKIDISEEIGCGGLRGLHITVLPHKVSE